MPRMTRVSPPELARELPGPHASTSVTRAPRRQSQSASHPPKAPAPTTATCGSPAAGAGPGAVRLRLSPSGPCIAALCKAGHDVGAGALVLFQLDDLLALGVLEQLRERAVAVVALVEGRLLALHGLLDHRAPEHVLVLADQRLDRLDHQAEGLGGLLVEAVELGPLLRVAPDVLVVDELVAVVDQQVGRVVLDADADDVLVVLLELRDQRREVAVAREDHESVQVLLGIGHVHGVDDHLDVGDAMDMSYAKEHLDTFVILSGDSDFSPLVSKLKENNKYVIGIGVKNYSSNLLVDNCDEFIYYEDIWRDAQKGPKLDGLSKKTAEAFSLMVESIQALVRENKDVLWGSMIKQTMQRKKPSFNEGYYGYSTFSELLEDAERKNIVKLKKDQRSGTYIVTGFAKSGDAGPGRRQA